MTDGVDAAVESDEAPGFDPMRDGSRREPRTHELRSRDQAVLAGGDRRCSEVGCVI
jgi:hypothetical protein